MCILPNELSWAATLYLPPLAGGRRKHMGSTRRGLASMDVGPLTRRGSLVQRMTLVAGQTAGVGGGGLEECTSGVTPSE